MLHCEHTEALATVTRAVLDPTADLYVATGAVDWLLFDWTLAHLESPETGGAEIRPGRAAGAGMIVQAMAASLRARSRIEPGLLALLVQ